MELKKYPTSREHDIQLHQINKNKLYPIYRGLDDRR